MKQLFAALLLTAFSQITFAGASKPYIDCTSASGKTKLTGELIGDILGSGLTFKIEKSEISYIDNDMHEYLLEAHLEESPYDNADVATFEVKEGLAAKKFSMTVSQEGKAVLRLKALSKTVKTKQTNRGERASFMANLQGVDPRHGGQSKVIVVKCNFTDEI